MSSAVGRRILRLEDSRLLRGLGSFVDNVNLSRQVHARFVRASVAHADLLGVDATRALAHPGVLAVLTAADFTPSPPRIPLRLVLTAHDLSHTLQPVLAAGRLRYVGEPVAVVVATDPYIAEDAAELVQVDYRAREVFLDARDLREPGTESLWEGHSNEIATLHGEYGDVDSAFDAADHVSEIEVAVGRHSGVPLENRGLVADYQKDRGHLVIYGMTKVPHFNRRVLADMLGLSTEEVHLRGGDAGGGFGIRGEFYPEDFLIPLLAQRLGRPVKWIEDRAEHLVAANHSREQRHLIAGAFRADGVLLGLRDEVWHDNGAYLRTHGVTVPDLTLNMLPGPYRVPAYRGVVHVVTTNKTPAGTYRAPGRYEGTFARERMFDTAAGDLEIDPVQLRRMNLLEPDDIPHFRPLNTLGTSIVLDAGDYVGLLDKALTATDYCAWVEEARAARAEGKMVGTGMAYFLEKSGIGPFETASVRIAPSGSITVDSGGTSLGQGIETVLAQIAADELGVEPEDISVFNGDTDRSPQGVGSWASRSTVVGGSAVKGAASQVADMIRRVAGELMGVSAEKIELVGGQARVGQTHELLSFGEVAAACAPGRTDQVDAVHGLSAMDTFVVHHMTYPYGVHLALVEIDPTTFHVRIRRYHVAYEVGRAINPTLVEGQVIGGLAQGIGGALLEEFRYSAEGQPQSTTFMDYLMPFASDMPEDVSVLICEDAPSPDNPLGAKGAGEGGTTAAAGAIANAVAHALNRNDAARVLPLSPARVRPYAIPGPKDPNGDQEESAVAGHPGRTACTKDDI